MTRSICIINGHPDSSREHFVPALADAYARGARAAGHRVSRIDVGLLPLDFLHHAGEFASPPGEEILAEREKLTAADHVVMIYPLWLGSMPARLKAFLEQLARGNFLLDTGGDSASWPVKKMRGKSARIIVTMGMPALAYRLIFGSHSVRATEQGVFGLSGFGPVHDTVLGMIGAAGPERRERMLARVEAMGRRGR